MSDYSEFFLNSRASILQLELIEVTHPDFTQPYRIVRNHADGVLATVDGEPTQFDYYPARVSSIGSRDNLDAGVKVELGDLGEVVPPELDAVEEAGGMLTKPRVRYWVFRSDDLTAAIFGPLVLEVSTFSFAVDGASFEARAPKLNVNRTGERYKLDRFPMLRGFL